MLELGLAARPRHEAADPGGVGSIDNVQTLVIGEASEVALLALVKRAGEGHRSQGGHQSFAAPPSAGHPRAARALDYFPGSMGLPLREQAAQDSRSAVASRLKHERLPGFEIRRLPTAQDCGQTMHLGALLQFHQEFFLHHLRHRQFAQLLAHTHQLVHHGFKLAHGLELPAVEGDQRRVGQSHGNSLLGFFTSEQRIGAASDLGTVGMLDSQKLFGKRTAPQFPQLCQLPQKPLSLLFEVRVIRRGFHIVVSILQYSAQTQAKT